MGPHGRGHMLNFEVDETVLKFSSTSSDILSHLRLSHRLARLVVENTGIAQHRVYRYVTLTSRSYYFIDVDDVFVFTRSRPFSSSSAYAGNMGY